jgi:protein YibB
MITIVTAFYEIGRGGWTDFERPTDHYFDSFKLLCRLKNPIILFTNEKFKPQIEAIQSTIKNNLIVYYEDIFTTHQQALQSIEAVQKMPSYQKGIFNPSCPEYWSAPYILVNYLKSFFCLKVMERQKNIGRLLAWIDFGYCRSENALPESLIWDFDFPNKINLFNILEVPAQPNIEYTIKNNIVYFQGCHIVAPPHQWKKFNELMQASFNQLINTNLIDDDQTLMLMAYLSSPTDFEIHKEEVNNKELYWYFIFKKYNKCLV